MECKIVSYVEQKCIFSIFRVFLQICRFWVSGSIFSNQFSSRRRKAFHTLLYQFSFCAVLCYIFKRIHLYLKVVFSYIKCLAQHKYDNLMRGTIKGDTGVDKYLFNPNRNRNRINPLYFDSSAFDKSTR